MVRCLFVIACLSIIAVMGKTVEGSSIEYAPFRYTVKEGLDPHPAENVTRLHFNTIGRLSNVALSLKMSLKNPFWMNTLAILLKPT